MEPLEVRCLLAGDLRISELNYNPHPALVQFGERDAPPEEFEFVEFANVGDRPLNLGGYELNGGITFRFGQQFLNPGERIVAVRDVKDFRSRYGNSVRVALGDDGDGGDQGEFGGKLSNDGETLQLHDPVGALVQAVTYFDRGEWPRRADGEGSSIEMPDPLADANDPKNWRPSGEFGGSPGWAGEGMRQEVVINELLTHTDLPQVDAVELFNRSDRTVDMTGWYMSDSAANIFRYRIPSEDGLIPAGDYLVLDENTLGFGFRGQAADNAFLIAADGVGRPLRFVDVVRYGATQNGVTLGRWPNGEGELFPMTELTFDDHNSGPLIGSVVISEIHYHPADPPAGVPLSVDEMEFVELTNRSGSPLDIGQWRLQQSVALTIPDGTTLGVGESLVALSFDPLADPNRTRAFLDLYGVSDDVQLLGPYTDGDDPNPDLLDDSGETLILDRPEDPEQLGLGYVLIDRVIYDDQDGWPAAADGGGASLTRRSLELYGDFAESWRSALPSPGRLGLAGDFDGNGRVEAEDIDALCAGIRLGLDDPAMDLDRNGTVDRQDLDILVGDILESSLGDANLDGVFNSRDLLLVFQAGRFEANGGGTVGWASGDWNCDGRFDTGDLLAAFQTGEYSPNAVAAALDADRTDALKTSSPPGQP